MNFAEVSSEVVRITGRPDKVVDIAVAINKAITYCTLKGNFHRDVIEASIPISPTVYGDTISIASLTRFRKFTYVKPTAVKYYLQYLAASKIFTDAVRVQPNIYYLAGTNMTYTLSALAAFLEVGYLTYPQVLDAVTNNTHWMMDLAPNMIVDLAASYVFSRIGDDQSARMSQVQGLDQFYMVRGDLSSID